MPEYAIMVKAITLKPDIKDATADLVSEYLTLALGKILIECRRRPPYPSLAFFWSS